MITHHIGTINIRDKTFPIESHTVGENNMEGPGIEIIRAFKARKTLPFFTTDSHLKGINGMEAESIIITNEGLNISRPKRDFNSIFIRKKNRNRLWMIHGCCRPAMADSLPSRSIRFIELCHFMN